MSDPIIPAGAFAAMKAGQPAPQAPAPKADAPKTITRKAEAPKDVKLSNSMSQDNPTPEAPKDMTPAEKKIWKLKVEGEEFDFDATDEEAVKREIMKARGADKRFQTAAQMKKQAEQFFEMLKDKGNASKFRTDPTIGQNFMELAKAAVWEQMQEEQMTPEQKEQRDKDKELEEYREYKRQKEEEGQTKAQKERQAQFETHYETRIMKALEIGGIPKTHAAVSRMADYLEKSLEHGYDLSPEELVQEVRKDYSGDISAILDSLTEDQLLSFIGENNAEKLRKADLKRLRSTQSAPFQQRENSRPPAKQAASPKKLGASEWKEDIMKSFLTRNR